MRICSSTAAAALAVAVAVLVGFGSAAEGQSDCASKLVSCAAYLNSTKPSSECCDAMKSVVTTQLPCLCGLINNPAALAGINLTQALQLPKYCNLPSNTSACNVCCLSAALSPGSSSLPPPGKNAAATISWMGMPPLLLASAFTFFYYFTT